MNKKTIYSLLVTMILMGSMIPLQTQALADTVVWHSSLDDQVIAWRIVDQYLFDSLQPPSLAGVDLVLGSVMAFEINDTLPTLYDDVYGTDMPPTFLKLIVNYQEVSFFDFTEDEPSFALQYMVIPYLFNEAASGNTLNITQLLEHRASLDPNVTSISYNMVGANYVRVAIFNDFLDSFVITYNNQTGIAADFFIEDDFGEMFCQLDIWESDIDDSGVTIDNTLDWHANLGAGTVLAWEFTDLAFDVSGDGFMPITETQNATVGGIITFEYLAAIPTDPTGYYGPDPSFFDVFYEEEDVPSSSENRAQSIIWLTMINPLSASLYNGTLVPMEDIHQLREINDPDVSSTVISTLGTNMHLEFELATGEGDDWDVAFDINTDSGIVSTLDVNIPGMVDFVMEFAPDNSTLNIDGSVITDTNETRTLPGFNWFYLMLSAIIAIPIIRRRKR
ncbi:MAG: hypothetical protein GOP50_05555 [Candidatus Heimdallarchaeota archaeon]|nr:hypothetical protein [Candidatus Heimdallarchaeota archaeon]